MTQAPNCCQLSDRDHAELQLLYTVSVSDIAGFKQQQWAVVNYALLIQAAWVAIARMPQTTQWPAGAWLLAVLTALTSLVAAFVLFGLQASIKERRQRLTSVREHFGKPFRDAWAVTKGCDPVFPVLVSALIVAALVAGLLVLGHSEF